MNAQRVWRKETAILLLTILFGLILFVAHGTFANPGLLANPGSGLAFLDFSLLPSGSTVRQSIDEWKAQGWTEGAECLQLVRAGGYLEIVVLNLRVPLAAHPRITHRSAYAPGCQGQGFAPVTITVNGTSIARSYAPTAAGFYPNAFTVDTWEVSRWITRGQNRIRITAGRLCSVYEIKRIEVSITGSANRLIEAHQMTHGIASNRPVDNVAAFSPSDRCAVCWIKVASEARGKRIEWRFYDPSGHLYFKTDRSANRYNWGWIRIRNWRAANLRGQWRVDVFINGNYQLSVPFTIGSRTNITHDPRITGVDFPSAIAANGEKNRGYVSFYDPDGDITSVRFDVVNAVHFTPFRFEPNVDGETNGSFRFRIYCNTRQTVTLKVTLYDRAGNASKPHLFTFRAT
ncbi:hypothetical protein KAX17_01465, partial [Candidatus Bipolaricaulota bacterium]|nr:hypothetical protein [Candidatus Bipolaricaulota bacterium]